MNDRIGSFIFFMCGLGSTVVGIAIADRLLFIIALLLFLCSAFLSRKDLV
jgi:hypothetical protein